MDAVGSFRPQRRTSLSEGDLAGFATGGFSVGGASGGDEEEEVDADTAFELLQRAQSHSLYFRGFEDEELRVLAERMNVMTFDKDDEIMQKGEPASWVGVVLDGKLEARDGRRVLGTSAIGDICGEIALFHGGVRNAGVVASESGAMAAIMISQLGRLYSEHPDLGANLVRLFGQATLAKVGSKNLVGSDDETTLTWNMPSKEAAESDKADVMRRLLASDDFTEGETAWLLEHVRYHRFNRGDNLMRRGEEADSVAVLLQGKLDAHVAPGQVLHVKPGELVGEVGFFKRQVRTVDVIGASDGGVLCGISYETIRNAGRVKPGLAFSLMKWLGSAAIAKVAPELSAAASLNSSGVEKMASVSEQAQLEVLYRKKMSKERQDKERLEEDHKEAEQEKTAAKHQVTNMKIMEKKLRAKVHEAELESRRLAEENEERLGTEQRLRDELRQLRQRAEEHEELLEKKDDELRSRKTQVDELLHKLRRPEEERNQLLSERKRLEGEYQAVIAELQGRLQKAHLDAKATQAEFDKQLQIELAPREAQLAERDERLGSLAARHAAAQARCNDLEQQVFRESQRRGATEERVHALQLQQQASAAQLHAAELERTEQLRTIHLQKLAAKALGVLYVQRLVTLKGELNGARRAATELSERLVDLPRQNAELQLEAERQGEIACELQREAKPLRAKLAEAVEAHAALEADGAALRGQLEARGAEMAEMQRARDELQLRLDAARVEQRQGHLKAQRVQHALRGECAAAASKLQLRDATLGRIEGAMARLAELEKGFGGLLQPGSADGKAQRGSLLAELESLVYGLREIGVAYTPPPPLAAMPCAASASVSASASATASASASPSPSAPLLRRSAAAVAPPQPSSPRPSSPSPSPSPTPKPQRPWSAAPPSSPLGGDGGATSWQQLHDRKAPLRSSAAGTRTVLHASPSAPALPPTGALNTNPPRSRQTAVASAIRLHSSVTKIMTERGAWGGYVIK